LPDDAALNSGADVIDQSLLNRFPSFQPSAGVLECEAEVSLAEIIQHFLPRGWFLPMTPGLKLFLLAWSRAVAREIYPQY